MWSDVTLQKTRFYVATSWPQRRGAEAPAAVSLLNNFSESDNSGFIHSLFFLPVMLKCDSSPAWDVLHRQAAA